MPLTPEVLNLLAERFGPAFSTSPETLEAHSRDESGLVHRPEAVLAAGSPQDAADLLDLACRFGFPVTPRGAGTGLAGGALACRGGVVLSLAGMNRILRVDPGDMVAEVEAGVITQDLRRAAEEAGLFYPPDPAGLDKSTLGGNAATNAGGPACLKYGVTRDYVLGMTVVTPTGRIVRTGAATRKNVAGFDLTRLLTGSEGLLGVICRLTLKLIPKPESVSCLAAVFPNTAGAMRGVGAVFQDGLLPCALEFLDHNSLALAGDLLPFELPDGQSSLLLMEFDGPARQTALDRGRAAAAARRAGAQQLLEAASAEERERLWWIRRQTSLRVHDRSAVYLSEDVVVPLSAIAGLTARLADLERRFGLDIFAFGHAGDGNIHVNISSTDATATDRAEACAEALARQVLTLGGTISGEHGVGLVKRRFLPLELSPANLALQQAVKRAFDPRGILNPGKVLPDPD